MNSLLNKCFLATLTLTFWACSKPTSTPAYHAKTVVIPQTPVENQGKIGLCWAYGTIGFVESIYKSKANVDVNLSEEALAFYHFAHALHKMFATLNTVELVTAFQTGGIPEGWYTRLPPEVLTGPVTVDDLDALDLIKRYGTVPESAWTFKVTTWEQHDHLMRNIGNKAMLLLAKNRNKEVSLDAIINDILASPEVFGSIPPQEFTYAGKNFTAQAFTSYLGLDPDAYSAVSARSAEDYDRIINVTKQALVRGLAVPFAYPIAIRRLKDDLFSGVAVPAETQGDMVNFVGDGGHLTLVTDFVNFGGKLGAVPTEELTLEANKNASELDYLYFKNSWGLGAKMNEAGIPLGGSDSGYYKIDQAYLKAAAKVGGYQGWVSLTVVVPKDIAENSLLSGKAASE